MKIKNIWVKPPPSSDLFLIPHWPNPMDRSWCFFFCGEVRDLPNFGGEDKVESPTIYKSRANKQLGPL